jgi:hypothetical protein
MARMAQLLRGSRGQVPARAFADRLNARLFSPRRVSRRAAFLSGLGALVGGIVAGVGLDRAMEPAVSGKLRPVVGANGRWYPVATLAELPEGTIRPFPAGAVQGFLIHHNGRLRALSSVCIWAMAESIVSSAPHSSTPTVRFARQGTPSGSARMESGRRPSSVMWSSPCSEPGTCPLTDSGYRSFWGAIPARAGDPDGTIVGAGTLFPGCWLFARMGS